MKACYCHHTFTVDVITNITGIATSTSTTATAATTKIMQ